MEKTERQLNLIALLMNRRRPLTSAELHKTIYADTRNEDAFKRKFERDKAELGEIGIVVETVPIDVWGDQKGFALKREETLLPEIGLAPDEHAALMLAAQAWQGEPGGASSSSSRPPGGTRSGRHPGSCHGSTSRPRASRRCSTPSSAASASASPTGPAAAAPQRCERSTRTRCVTRARGT